MNDAVAFDAIAERYLRDDEHWGADLDVLKNALEKLIDTRGMPIKYFDVGCGPGFHLACISRMFKVRGGIYALGLDQSKRMLATAQDICHRLNLNVAFVNAEFFEYEARERWTLVSCLNNGLGNMILNGTSHDEARERAMSKFRELLWERGYFVLSVYNREKLSDDYGRNFKSLAKSDRQVGDIYLEYSPRPFKHVEYYSHWFAEEEITSLLERHGFEIDLLERRMTRFVIQARAL